MALARLQIEMTAEADGLSYKEAKAANHRAANDSDSVLMNINLLKVEAYARRRGLGDRFAWASWLLPRSSIAGTVFGLLTLAVMSQ